MKILNKRTALVCAGLAVCNVLVAAAAQEQDVSFEEARTYGTGDTPASVAVGDFNGDGRQDLAVTYRGVSPGGVSVLLGNGDGTFQAAQNFAGQSYPFSVVVGDFNGDGRQDLAVTNLYSGTVCVLLGNGDGSFQAARKFAVGRRPWSVTVGDFNGDGRQDLAVANQDSNTVSVLLGNGDGSFQAQRDFAVGTSPVSVRAGDFNGDGMPDLAAVYEAGPPNYKGGVSVLLGNGEGSFQAPRNFAVGSVYLFGSLALGDFNGDGRPDLALVNYPSNNVSVLINNTHR